MASWWGWKWRCGNVFGDNGKCRDRVRFVREIAAEVTKAHKAAWGRAMGGVTETRLLSWKPPEPGWVKVNTDGASRGNPGLATSGGVIRNEEGDWCGGFAVNIGVCSAPLAEIWGVYYGLSTAWNQGSLKWTPRW